MLKIFIGYDRVESVAYHTLCSSILLNSSGPVSFCPVYLKNLVGIFNRQRDSKQSNEFSYSRFLTPFLADFSGPALYMDCDMLITCDIYSLIDQFDWDSYAVSVVKHDYLSKVQTKYLGNVQYHYPRKNWSSFMLFNASHPANRVLTPDFVANASGQDLHRFAFLDDGEIGSLEIEWNYLVGEYPPREQAPSVLHYTLGGPYFDGWENSDFADDWFSAYEQMIFRERNEGC